MAIILPFIYPFREKFVSQFSSSGTVHAGNYKFGIHMENE